MGVCFVPSLHNFLFFISKYEVFTLLFYSSTSLRARVFLYVGRGGGVVSVVEER